MMSRRLLLGVVATLGLLMSVGTAAVMITVPPRGAPVVDRVATFSMQRTATPDRPPHQSRAPAPPRLNLAVLGDSVPAASACSCVGFSSLFGRAVAEAAHATVKVDNVGTPQLTSQGLQASLAAGTPTARIVAAADIVTVTIGANDFQYGDYSPDTCKDLSCYGTALTHMRTSVDGILAQIATLRAGRPTAVRVTGYWDVWKDGDVGRAEGEQYTFAGDALTRKVNDALKASALAHGASYVDLYAPFRGANGTDDDTGLLAADGDHPNSSGHARIAQALLGAGLAPLLQSDGP